MSWRAQVRPFELRAQIAAAIVTSIGDTTVPMTDAARPAIPGDGQSAPSQKGRAE